MHITVQFINKSLLKYILQYIISNVFYMCITSVKNNVLNLIWTRDLDRFLSSVLLWDAFCMLILVLLFRNQKTKLQMVLAYVLKWKNNTVHTIFKEEIFFYHRIILKQTWHKASLWSNWYYRMKFFCLMGHSSFPKVCVCGGGVEKKNLKNFSKRWLIIMSQYSTNILLKCRFKLEFMTIVIKGV